MCLDGNRKGHLGLVESYVTHAVAAAQMTIYGTRVEIRKEGCACGRTSRGARRCCLRCINEFNRVFRKRQRQHEAYECKCCRCKALRFSLSDSFKEDNPPPSAYKSSTFKTPHLLHC